MKEIPLAQTGLLAIVDDDTYGDLMQHKWQVRYSGSGAPYVGRTARIGVNKTKSVSMHRYLMGNPEGMDVHHKNHNTLDNRRENLEVITHIGNLHKRRERKTKSGYKGVYLLRGKWRMTIQRDFDNPIDASLAFEAAYKLLTEMYPFVG